MAEQDAPYYCRKVSSLSLLRNARFSNPHSHNLPETFQNRCLFVII